MELACLQDDVPIGSISSKYLGNAIAEGKDAECIEESKDSPNCAVLRVSPKQ